MTNFSKNWPHDLRMTPFLGFKSTQQARKFKKLLRQPIATYKTLLTTGCPVTDGGTLSLIENLQFWPKKVPKANTNPNHDSI